ncbi:DNA/RNA non-specific endonuclease [Chryseolinea sp. T2]|uniref:DNA/RNA non-specific endonuclease n=1 Tax=Chryseolinea sp. T2 TaxID=3129255 RepID=UPI003076A0EF
MIFPSYQENFISGFSIPLPKISKSITQIATLIDSDDASIIEYPHYCCIMHKTRKLAFYSACNIDGNSVDDVNRSGDFKSETRINSSFQTGDEFYEGRNDIFDKGHLTKYEDVMWGTSISAELKKLGDTTFRFPNCVPQHQTFNRGMWSSLEKYILDQETDKLNLRICLFTGPLLQQSDPVLVEKINGKSYKVPILFWKVVIYSQDNKLYGVAFIMSQKTLVKQSGLVKTNRVMEIITRAMRNIDAPAFMDYKHNKPYQARVELIQQLTGIKFKYKNIIFPYQESRPKELIFEEVDIIKPRSMDEIDHGPASKVNTRSKYVFKNMKLS